MKARFLKIPYRVGRVLVIAIILLVVVLPAALYVALSLSGVRSQIKAVAQRELTALTGERVTIGHLGIMPFNSVTMWDVAVGDDIRVARLGAGVELWPLLRGDIVISYAELVGADISLRRDSVGAPLNIQPLIDRLSRRDTTREKKPIRLSINNIVVRKSAVSYDVLSLPSRDGERFDPNHIRVNNLQADISLPRISDTGVVADLRRLEFAMACGLRVEKLSSHVTYTPDSLLIDRFLLTLPDSRLALDDIALGTEFLKTRQLPRVSVRTLDGCRISSADLSAFFTLPRPIAAEFGFDAQMDGESLTVTEFDLSNDACRVSVTGLTIDNLPDLTHHPRGSLERLYVEASSALADGLKLQPSVRELINRAGRVRLTATAQADGRTVTGGVELLSGLGSVRLRDISADLASPMSVRASLRADSLRSDAIPGLKESLGLLSLDADLFAAPGRYLYDGEVAGLTLNGHTFEPLSLMAEMVERQLKVTLDSPDPDAAFYLQANALTGSEPELDLMLEIERLLPGALGVRGRWGETTMAANVEATLSGSTPDNLQGIASLTDIRLEAPDRNPLSLPDITIEADSDSLRRRYALSSDIMDGELSGRFLPSQLGGVLARYAAQILPGIVPQPKDSLPADSQLALRLSLEPDSATMAFLGLPVAPLSPVTLAADLNEASGMGSVTLSAPYLRQGNKLIEASRLNLSTDARSSVLTMDVATRIPAKGGSADISLSATGERGQLNAAIGWRSLTGIHHGRLGFDIAARRIATETGQPLLTTINILPGEIVFNDTTWVMSPSQIVASKELIDIRGFRVSHRDQEVTIDGAISADETDLVDVNLRDIDLDYIFSTLAIPNVTFGGHATGNLLARRVLSPEPQISTGPNGLAVQQLSYNGCVMGDAVISSRFNNEDQSISIDADVRGKEDAMTYVRGKITPGKELLDFTFIPDHAPVGFLLPFMSAFCSGVSGEVTGNARLYGTFKNVDLEGIAYAHNLKLDITMTGTSYWASDSIRILPGLIRMNNITLNDSEGHTAVLNGELSHTYFHDAVFDFRITQARSLLCYNEPPSTERPWYGRVYANGNVNISGRPGRVDIDVNAETAPNTTFTFELRDTQVASDYDFITFRDRTPAELLEATVQLRDTIPEAVRRLRQASGNAAAGPPTDYAMIFNVDITPEAKINLVMDPAAGDVIRSTGVGSVRMNYDSRADDLRMYGTYTLQQGNYNFSLQDLILKNFIIEDGSSIAFHGDPYNAILDIRAHYALNANLSDLDDSFLQDRELNRTNVPVHAMLFVTGDMRQPDISFDLEFPTLSQDTYRKVKSIVSTEDMMNRQIIYLLALNRFYTPEYMSATRGNELVSVASSTLSSQLSSMLGQLSNNFSIAPTLRSDRGDFSDVEVDVALSSNLLNNRLLVNGVFGYRDKSLNNNSFIGDFDIEYLLNRAGTLRLKAYNRFNDQTFYFKEADTTQGVGIMFKRDFDTLRDLFRPLRPKLSPRLNTDSLRTADPVPPQN